MTNVQTSTLVFKDEAGEYYLLPQAALERGRVPAAHRAEIERLAAESGDVSGHHPFLIGMFVGVLLGGGTAVGTLAYHLNDIEVQVPTIEFPR
jgi:hypothetical protein